MTLTFGDTTMSEFFKIMIQVFMMFTFLSLFFFLFVVKVEREEFNHQIKFITQNLVDELGQELKPYFPEPQPFLQELCKILTQIYNNTTIDPQSHSIQQHNQEIINHTVQLVVKVGLVLITAMLCTVIFKYALHLKQHFWENFMVLVSLGLVELIFLETVTKNYISADPNFVKKTLFENVATFAAHHT